MSSLTHIDANGAAQMVDVGAKAASAREAVATGRIALSSATLAAIADGTMAKGNVIATARIAGIMAAKRTSDLIPLCHPLMLDKVGIDFMVDDDGITVTATARLTGKTGVEMEALTAVSIALLTIYDMVKAMERDACISDIRLLAKSGGKSGAWRASA